jgi:hypothetical protein
VTACAWSPSSRARAARSWLSAGGSSVNPRKAAGATSNTARTTRPRLFPFVRVSTWPETGTDGHTLSGLYEIPETDFYLYEGGTNQGFYRTAREEPIRYQPQGIYYWQMNSGRYQTQIYSFVRHPQSPTPQPSPNPTFSSSPGLASPETERQTPLRCHRGSTKAHIGGKTECLHSGHRARGVMAAAQSLSLCLLATGNALQACATALVGGQSAASILRGRLITWTDL